MTDHIPTVSPDMLAQLLEETSPYLSCDDCFTRLDSYVEQLLRDPRQDDPAMAAHLRGCPACADEAASLQALLGTDPAWPTAPHRT
jgi:hypothetical protein